VPLDECELQYAAEVLGSLFVSREDPAAFLQPADQSLDDIAPLVRVAIELHRPGLTILVLLRWDHRQDSQFQEKLVDPTNAAGVNLPSWKAHASHRPNAATVPPRSILARPVTTGGGPILFF
jgi:hypothetical protein